MQIAAIAGFKRSGTRDLGQEPRSALSLVDPILDQAGGRHIVVLLAEFMSGTKFSRELLIVVEKLGQHINRRDEFRVVVLQPLMLCDVPDRVDRGPAKLASALGDIVGHGEDLLRLFVKQQVVIAEVLPAHVPVKILGLQVEREYVGKEFPQRAGYIHHCIAAEIG